MLYKRRARAAEQEAGPLSQRRQDEFDQIRILLLQNELLLKEKDETKKEDRKKEETKKEEKVGLEKPISYPNLKRLEKHKTTHANVKCDNSDKIFSAKTNLKRHCKNVHKHKMTAQIPIMKMMTTFQTRETTL